MRDYRRYGVWEKAHALAVAVYKATEHFPRSEMYGLTNQMRRAAVSVSSNIAEGCGRGGDGEFARFCRIALGSATELEYQLLLTKDLAMLTATAHEPLDESISEVKRMLAALIRRLEESSPKRSNRTSAISEEVVIWDEPPPDTTLNDIHPDAHSTRHTLVESQKS